MIFFVKQTKKKLAKKCRTVDTIIVTDITGMRHPLLISNKTNIHAPLKKTPSSEII